jgi:undecaprenyl-diphosphatase
MIDVTIVLHLGTLGSIVLYYWRRIWRLCGADRRTIGLMILGTIPAVLLGLPMKLWGGPLLESPLLAGLMLPVTGLALLWAMRQPAGETKYPDLSWAGALWIGVGQAAAILPGLSRSGSTIAVGLKAGLARQEAATFSFLLAIPAIAGAGMLEGFSILKNGHHAQLAPAGYLAVGAAVSLVVGLAALWLLERLLVRGQLQWFAYYCIGLGAAVVVWQLTAG